MQDLETYLKPAAYIDSKHPEIKKESSRLTKDCSSMNERARRLFYFVRDECHYNMYEISPHMDDYKASSIIQKKQGWCLQKAILLAALGRAADLPTRLVVAAIRNHRLSPEAYDYMGTNLFFPHAYNQFFLNGRWLSATPTFEQSLCEKTGVPTVEFDGFQDSILSSVDNSGNPYIEYVEILGYYDDLPFSDIRENLPRFYGDRYKEWFSAKS